MNAVLRSEWTKVRTTADLAGSLLLLAGLTVAVAAVVAVVAGPVPDRVHASLLGVQAGQAVAAVAGIRILAGEYGTGLIRITFAALPRRLDVLAAKALLLTGGVAAAGGLAVAGSVLAGRLLIDGYPPMSGTVLRSAGGSVLYLCLIALLGLGVAAVVRDAATAAGVTLGLLYLLPAVLWMFGDPDWQRAIYRITPSTAGLGVQVTVDVSALPIGPWAGLGVTAGWAVALLTVGALLTARRDA